MREILFFIVSSRTTTFTFRFWRRTRERSGDDCGYMRCQQRRLASRYSMVFQQRCNKIWTQRCYAHQYQTHKSADYRVSEPSQSGELYLCREEPGWLNEPYGRTIRKWYSERDSLNNFHSILICPSLYINCVRACFAKPFPFAVPPQIMPFEFGEEPVNAQEMVLVTCTVSKGDLPLKIQWYFNGKSIKSGEIGVNLANTKRTSQLSIESVTHENQGNYSCVVNNDAGNTNHTAQLYVNGINSLFELNNSRDLNIDFVYSVYSLL